MPKISYVVIWSPNPTERRAFVGDGEQRVGDIADMMVLRLQLPERNAFGQPAEYTLYRAVGEGFEPIPRQQTLAQAHVQSGQRLFLDSGQSWLRSYQADDASDGPEERSITARQPSDTPRLQCRIRLAPDCEQVVGGDGVTLCRDYLIRQLPPGLVAREWALHFAGHNSRLAWVSRDRHCLLRPGLRGWELIVYQLTYLNGRKITGGVAELSGSSESSLILGRRGWPVEVQLLLRGEKSI